MEELQRRTGFQVKNGRFDVLNFDDMLAESMERKIDIAGGAITLTRERCKNTVAIGPTYNSSVVVVVNKQNSDIKRVNDLKGRTIASEIGAEFNDLIDGTAAEDHIKLHETTTNFVAIYRVSRGMSDSLIVDEPVARDYIRRWGDSNLKISFALTEENSPMGLLLKKDSRVSKVLSDTYSEMEADGTVQRIVEKYLGTSNIEYPKIASKKSYSERIDEAQNPYAKSLTKL